ncbi:MAG: serine/threonine protein kinase [Deltaproteobacteria bacterium]|nr:serine/threonine protein kinase [Deltaproteobacteria bacterium]
MPPPILNTVAFGAVEPATRKDGGPAAKANSGFQHVWNGLDIDSATVELVHPAGTLSPKRPAPDTGRRAHLAALPVVQVTTVDAHDRSAVADLSLGPSLGAGGMGLVQLATQNSLGREVAVKTVKADVADPIAAAAELVREARIAGRLEHPNILPIYALGQDDAGRPMLVMKRVEGTVWRELIKSDPPFRTGPSDHRTAAALDEALVRHLLVLIQVCNAVSFAHSKGVVHRDLKPENVMVGSFGEVYVLDWGVAVELGQAGAGGQGIAGTPNWMAPEMVAPSAEGLGPHTDVYLLGGLLHAVLTGTPLHAGDDLYQVLYQAWLSAPKDYGSEVPGLLADLCRRATSKDAAARPESAAAFKADVEHYLRHRTSLALAQQAQARLADLETLVGLLLGDQPDLLPQEAIGDDTAGLVHRLGGEARFGFQQALATWPDNPLAIDGYQMVCAVMARFAIAEGDVRTAGHLIGEIAQPDDALLAAWRALSAARSRTDENAARLAQIERDMDFDAGSTFRSGLALSIAVVWAAIPLIIGVLERTTAFAVTFPRYLAAGVMWAAFVAGGVYLGRRALFSNRVNRAFVRSLAGAVAAPLLLRTVSWVQGGTVRQAVTYDMVLFFLVLIGMAATIDWRLAWGAGVYGVAASVSTALPGYEFFVLAAANLLALGTVAWVWRPVANAETRRARLIAHLQAGHSCLGGAAWNGLRAAVAPVARAVPAVVEAAVARSTSRSAIAPESP